MTAAFSRPIGRYPRGEECGEAILHFDNGTIATLAASWVDLVEPASLLITGTKGHAVIRNASGMPHNDWDNKLFLLTDAVDGVTAKEPWTDLPEACRARWSSSSTPSPTASGTTWSVSARRRTAAT